MPKDSGFTILMRSLLLSECLNLEDTHLIISQQDLFYVSWVSNSCHCNVPYRSVETLSVGSAGHQPESIIGREHVRKWDDFDISSWKTDTSLVDVFDRKCF